MGKSNKNARMKLEKIFGKSCMFQKAGIEKEIEKLKNITSYKKYLKEVHYTKKRVIQLQNNLTYHHLHHKADGGLSTVENGAEISELVHRYIHSLPRAQEELINNLLRNYKKSIISGVLVPTDDSLMLSHSKNIDLTLDDYIEVPLVPNSKPPKKKYNRAKITRESNKYIDDVLAGNLDLGFEYSER